MRALIVVLAAANLLFAAWAAGWLDAVTGWPANADRDPRRLERQVRPEKVRPVRPGTAPPRQPAAMAQPPAAATQPAGADPTTPAPVGPNPPTTVAAAPVAGVAPPGANAASAAPGPPPAGFEPGCFEAGPFTPAEVVAAEAALVRAALPAGSWSDVRVHTPGEWIIYAGRYPTREGLERKIEELKRHRVAFEEVRDMPDLELGLAVGRFRDRAEAEAALALLTQQGMRNMRVLATAPPATTHLLRIERADAALQSQLAALRAPALGAGFVRCGLAAAASPGR